MGVFQGLQAIFRGSIARSRQGLEMHPDGHIANMHPPHFLRAAQAFLVDSGFLGASCGLIEVFKSPGHNSHFVFALFGFP